MAIIEMNNVIEEVAGVSNPLRSAGAPVNGTSGTGVNHAGTGAQLVDTTNGVLYINTGTSASPTWVKVGAQS